MDLPAQTSALADSLAISITVPLGKLQQFAACLAAYLEPDMPFSESEIHAAASAGSGLALSLRLEPDGALAQFSRENPEIECSVPGQVAVGYLFCTARSGPASVEIAFYTSSRSVVTVLKESEQVRSLLLRLGRFGQPQEVRITDEWNDVTTLPARGEA